MTPQQHYQTDIERGGFKSDPLQAAAVTQFQRLYSELLVPSPQRGLSFMERRLKGQRPPSPQGLYLWGGPGRGKT
ncbi:MAG: cell division protein ZapE, partial [Gammaproteobacteria bacterium]|nr:cell division protein ZapE [Gammaproteobacteria bacterium]